MSRIVKHYTDNNPVRDSIVKELKEQYGSWLSQNQLIKYLQIGHSKTEMLEAIPYYNVTNRKRYRSVDIADWLCRHRIGTVG